MPDDDELRRHWPAVLACFCAAVFAWGFGFYGQTLYLADIRARAGWPAALVAGAATAMYLGGALVGPWILDLVRRCGAASAMAGGALLLGIGASALVAAESPAALYAAALAMALGWSACSGIAIAVAIARRFDARRGLALSLALNGASAAGFTITPLLAHLAQGRGLRWAVPAVAAGAWLLLAPVLFWGLRAAAPDAPPASQAPAAGSKARMARDPRFLSLALPFALALLAQVGFVVHMAAFMLPALGASGAALAVSLVGAAAMLGRFAAGFRIDRMALRPFAAASIAAQAAGMAAMLAWPLEPWALYAGAALLGISVGNVITLPPLIAPREFPPAAYGLVVGLSGAIGQFALAFGPALFGLLRDATGDYRAVLAACAACQIAAAAMVVRPWPIPPRGTPR